MWKHWGILRGLSDKMLMQCKIRSSGERYDRTSKTQDVCSVKNAMAEWEELYGGMKWWQEQWVIKSGCYGERARKWEHDESN